MNVYKVVRNDGCLQHHGIPGQKWGIRRFQNEDGSLTNEGKLRYGIQRGWEAKEMYKRGVIDTAEYKSRKKADNAFGKLDNALSLGTGRAQREFVQRHKKGLIAASSVLSAINGVAIAALKGYSPLNIAISAGESAVLGALVPFIGLSVNDFILDKAYNQR